MGRTKGKQASPVAAKSDAGGQPWTAKLALAVSALSLAISGLTLYFNYLAPFGPLVSVGGPVFQLGIAAPENTAANAPSPPDFDPIPRRILAVVFLPVTITHKGGSPGVVSDLMLKMSRTGFDDRWLFEPRMFIDERALLTTYEPNSHLKWLESVFEPIPVAKGDRVRRVVMFQAQENATFPGGRLRAAEYDLQVLARTDSDEFHDVGSFKIDFRAEVLGRIDANTRYAPTPAELLPARQLLK